MKEYQKIEQLYQFDSDRRRFTTEIKNPLVKYLAPLSWLVSEKIDGMNIRVNWDGHKVTWSGRTDKSQLPVEVEQLLSKTFGDTEVIFEQNFGEKEVTLYMECYGGKIQGGIYGGSERLIGFDVEINGTYLDKRTIEPIFNLFKIPTVWFTEVRDLGVAITEVCNWFLYDTPNSYSTLATPDKKTKKEGLVCVPTERIYDHQGKRVIVKIKLRDLQNSELNPLLGAD